MSPTKRCENCDFHEQRGHNYCRMYECYFKKGKVHNVRIAVTYNTNEKFCGYCGGAKHNCGCR